MAYDKELIAGKLRRWDKYLTGFRLPEWESIPDMGLYMEQTVALLRQYIDYLPPEMKGGQVITATAINNYIRLKLMPRPVKRRYYREHIAYLIIICTLKQNLSLSMLPKIIPTGMTRDEVREVYTAYAKRHAMAARYFVEQVRSLAAPILENGQESELSTGDTGEMIITSAIMGSFARLLSEKLIPLDDRTLANGGSIEDPPARNQAASPEY